MLSEPDPRARHSPGARATNVLRSRRHTRRDYTQFLQVPPPPRGRTLSLRPLLSGAEHTLYAGEDSQQFSPGSERECARSGQGKWRGGVRDS